MLPLTVNRERAGTTQRGVIFCLLMTRPAKVMEAGALCMQVKLSNSNCTCWERVKSTIRLNS